MSLGKERREVRAGGPLITNARRIVAYLNLGGGAT